MLNETATIEAPNLFDGMTIEPRLDNARLTSQLARVYRLMSDGRWRTLSEIAAAINGSEAGVSARLRDLRKEKFQADFPNNGVNRKRRGDPRSGLWEYQLIPA